jgi:hypothetical protein
MMGKLRNICQLKLAHKEELEQLAVEASLDGTTST